MNNHKLAIDLLGLFVYTVYMLISKVPQQLALRSWTPHELSKRAGMSSQTGQRLARGDTDFSLSTLLKLCDLFQVRKISEVIEYKQEAT